MQNQQARIVILGGGFAGAYCARRLSRKLRRRPVEITLVNAQNNFTFTPLLVEAATSALEPRHVTVPLRGFLKHCNFVMAQAQSVHLQKQFVAVQPPFGDALLLEFDHLVLALGSITRMPAISGLSEHGYGLKSMSDAMALRDRAIQMLEMANLSPSHKQRRSWLTFAIVGAGYTGVEAAGEFNAFLCEAVRYYPHVRESDVRVLLIQRADRILETLDEKLSRKASKILTKRGVEILLNDSVKTIAKNTFTLQSGQTIAAHTLIWSAGVAPPPLLENLDLAKNSHGYLACDPDCRVTGRANIWGIGDCASNPDPSGNAYPPTAQHALREGLHAADNLAAILSGRPTQPLRYHAKGTMAPLGGRQAIADVWGMHLTGLPAWLLWRTVYLAIMPGWGRRVRVAMDWTADFFFRRDYSQQGFQK